MKALLLSTLLLACLPVFAAEEPAAGQDSLQVLVDQQHALKAKLDAGNTDGLTPRQLREVRTAQDQFFAVTQGKSTLDQLSINEKVTVENALERINATVKNSRAATDDQNVCWRERPSGTTMKVTRCGTKAEMRQAREGARDYLDRPKTCGRDCGGL